MSMQSVTRLEKRIIWISLAFAMVLLGLSALAINLFHVGLPTCLTDIKPFQKGELITHSPTHYELHYVARMWKFEPEDVTVPAGSTVDIYLSAADVTHGLIMLGTNLNLMAVPGVVNYARVKFDKPRVYQLLCHEFCGTGHDRMAAKLNVVDTATFAARPSPPVAPEPVHPGYKLMDANLCLACHSTDGQAGIGPTLKGVYGRTEKLKDGSTVTVDDAFIHEKILHPDAKIIAGRFEQEMPKTDLSPEEIEEIIQYLQTLK
ncbi:MAG: c-type cytochrome [Candidatus Udaeobacter sp.]